MPNVKRPAPIRTALTNPHARIPVTGHHNTGINSGGVGKTLARAVMNRNARKPQGTS